MQRAATYNHAMRSPSLSLFRHGLIGFAGLVMLSLVQAQTAPPAAPAGQEALQKGEQGAGRTSQKIEHIHIEDSGAAVDEVRYGGQTQSITVKPKANVPSYEVLPNNYGGRTYQGPGEAGSGGNGPRVWNVLKF